jgi:hypothetical protein
MMEDKPYKNEDVTIWEKVPGDYYSPRIYATKGGGIAINVSGTVVGNTVEEWHKLPDRVEQQDALISELVAALDPFLPAYIAFTDAMNGFRVSGETDSDRFASAQEREATAKEEAFLSLSDITFDQLNAVNNALTKARKKK